LQSILVQEAVSLAPWVCRNYAIWLQYQSVDQHLSASGLRSALEELWEIFKLASERTPDLAEHIRFVISGQFNGHENPQQVIQGWRTQSEGYSSKS
jgi:hypothetical protein